MRPETEPHHGTDRLLPRSPRLVRTVPVVTAVAAGLSIV